MNCDHQEFTDPRGKGSCRKCGRVIPDPFPAPVVDEFFDRLQEGLEGAGEGDPGPALDYYKLMALRRLAKGAREYGNTNFLNPDRDIPMEFIEECLDGSNYILMERLKTQPRGSADLQLDLAAFHLFQAYQAMLQYRHKRD
jgi:hypothetical protein